MIKYNSAAVYHPNGNFMFYCEERRANWYLNRNLAEKLNHNNNRLEIKLTFEPKGIGPNDEFSANEILQRCVVCGTEQELTKHHVVPSCYRKHFPKEYKSRINHDVVLICKKHHTVYEDFANVLKDKLSKKYKVPTLSESSNINPLLKKLGIIKSLCVAYQSNINNEKTLIKIIDKFNTLDINIRSKTDVDNLLIKTNNDINLIKNMTIDINHGQMLVSKIENYDSFIKIWRKHFINIMQPNYMPIGWSIFYKTKIDKTL